MSFHNALYDQYLGLNPWAQTFVQVGVLLLVALVGVALLHKWLEFLMGRSKRVDKTVQDFLLTLFHIGAWGFVALVILAVFGVNAAALAGIVAVGGFIVGFAVKDSLGNLAAGVTLLIYRPFNVDDVVTIGDVTGKVTSLGLAMTTIRLYDARIATVSNGQVLTDVIENHTRETSRMADVEVGIAYDDDIETAVKAILAALQADPRVLAEPAPEVRIRALGDSSVNLHVRPWVLTADVWKAKADFQGVVKRALDEAGCSIPFPQRDVHVFSPGGNGGSDEAVARTEASSN